MNQLDEEYETTRTTNLNNTFFAYMDAMDRGKQAKELNPDFFDSEEHKERVSAVVSILTNFFNKQPDYINQRGLGNRKNKPFEVVKMSNVGTKLRLTSQEAKDQNLIKPLNALKNIRMIPSNGHFLVHIY